MAAGGSRVRSAASALRTGCNACKGSLSGGISPGEWYTQRQTHGACVMSQPYTFSNIPPAHGRFSRIKSLTSTRTRSPASRRRPSASPRAALLWPSPKEAVRMSTRGVDMERAIGEKTRFLAWHAESFLKT